MGQSSSMGNDTERIRLPVSSAQLAPDYNRALMARVSLTSWFDENSVAAIGSVQQRLY